MAKNKNNVSNGQISLSALKILKEVSVHSDEAFLKTASKQISQSDFEAAFYSTVPAIQLSALEVAGYCADPWPVLPYLAAFTSARERRASSVAVLSLINALNGISDLTKDPVFPVKGQKMQLFITLDKTAADTTLDKDIRAGALYGIVLLNNISGSNYIPDEALFFDKIADIRIRALSMLPFPLDKNALKKLSVAAGDDDETVKGCAASILCENALSLGVDTLSEDLSDFIEEVLNEDNPRSSAGVMGCLARLKPADRAGFSDIIANLKDSRLQSYWNELLNNS